MFERDDVAAAWSDRPDAASVERWAALRRDRDHAGHYNLMHDRKLKRLRAELAALQRRNLPALRRSSVASNGALAASPTDRANSDLGSGSV